MDHNGVEDGSFQHQGGALGSAASSPKPAMSVPATANRAPDTRVVTNVAISAFTLAPPILLLTRTAIVKAPAASVKKLRPGIEVVNWITAAEIRP